MNALLDAIATYRLTRLVTADDLAAVPRDAVVRWSYEHSRDLAGRRRAASGGGAPVEGWSDYAIGDDNPPKLATLVTCRWCASMWLGLGVVAARRLFPRAWAPLASALTYSAGAALLARLEDG